MNEILLGALILLDQLLGWAIDKLGWFERTQRKLKRRLEELEKRKLEK